MKTLFALLFAALAVAGEAPRTGTYKTTFAERHPEGVWKRMALRIGGLDPKRTTEAYDIAKEEFDVFVPPEYDGSVPYGLIVYTSPGKGGGAGMYKAELIRHRVIWIGASNVPNERDVVPRFGLSLDAVWNMRQRYNIDAQRIYAAGFSGGGRCASMVVPAYAEVWSGAMYICGCNSVQLPNDKQVGQPISKLAPELRFAFVTGDGDFNRPGTKSVFDGYRGMGFKRIEYFEQPGLEHKVPSAEWFEKALQFLDRPLVEAADALVTQAKAAEAKKPYEAGAAYRQILAGTAVATAARAAATERLAALTPAIDELLRAELAKLGDAKGDKLRAFVARAAGFPCAGEARTLAEAAGDKELEPILAQPGAATPGKLKAYLATWKGYACAVRAAEAYEGFAAKALEPLAAQEAGKRGKALLKFLKDWDECPSRSKAKELLEADLATELAAILALDKPAAKAPKLAAFAKAWPGTEAAAQAEAALAELAAKPK